MTERFDWNEDDSVVIRTQPAIAIQGDEHGDVMLRQEGQYCISEDQFVDIRHENVLAICRALLREAGLHRFMIIEVDEIGLVGRDGNTMHIPAGDLEKLDRIAEEMRQERNKGRPVRARPPQTQPRDPTAALRKQRQRQRQRENSARDTVTDRDTVTVTAPQLLLAHG
jgi:hypothetical protein